jgi:hypothetical protein
LRSILTTVCGLHRLPGQAALVRLAAEMDVDTGIEEYDSLTAMLEGLVRWRRPGVAEALLRGRDPLQLLAEMWLASLPPDVFVDEHRAE